MSNLYSSSGDIRFYNYISNTFFAGVPNATIATNNDKGLVNWIHESAFASIDVNVSSLIVAWRFPRVVGSPTEPETNTTQVTVPSSSTTTGRFGYRFSNLYSHSVGSNNSNFGLGVRTGDGSTINPSSTLNYVVIPHFLSTSTSSTFYTDTQPLNLSRVTFAVKSPTTMLFAEFWLNSNTYQLLSNPHRCSVLVHGWLHEHNTNVFSTLPMGRIYGFSLGTDSSLNLKCIHSGNRLISGTSFQSLQLRYYRITCPQYADQELFLTDLVLYDTIHGVSVQLGKVDNRIACLGRGNFRPGLIYRVSNIFGRTGIEHWLCACSYMTGDYRAVTYSDLDFPKELYLNNDFHNPKDRDYLMFRVNLRTDLP